MRPSWLPPWDNDPLEWHSILSPWGQPAQIKLEKGFVYKFSGVLTPGSHVRVLDEHGNGRFAAVSTGEEPYRFSTDFIMERDMGAWVMVQYCGELHHPKFEIDGISTKELS